jgi:Family of unknown function (DUF6169)
MSYDYLFKGGSDNSFGFETDKGVIYDVQFRPSPYLLGDENAIYANDIYEFIIEIVYNPTDKSPALDNMVSPTIAAIFMDFYIRKSETICIFICDSSDDRQDIRRRKFDQWFYEYQDYTFSKIDDKFIDSHKNIFPISMIIKKSNPNFSKIVFDFNTMILKYNTGK